MIKTSVVFADGKDDNTTNNDDAHTEEKPDKSLSPPPARCRLQCLKVRLFFYVLASLEA